MFWWGLPWRTLRRRSARVPWMPRPAAVFHSNLGQAYRALRRIPEAFACYRRALELKPDFAPPVTPLPALNRGQVTFGCFNNPAKITPQVIEVWAEILRRLGGADAGVRDPLRAVRGRGVMGADRLITVWGSVALSRRGLHHHELYGGNDQHDCKKTAKGNVRQPAAPQVRADCRESRGFRVPWWPRCKRRRIWARKPEALARQGLRSAEGTGFEPATPFGAPHFQCGR